MNLLDELKKNGVNIDEGLERMMGNSGLYQKLLIKLSKMIKESSISPDFDENNYSDIIEKVHTIKGAVGNLAVTPLYKAYSEMLVLLREGKPKHAKIVLKEVLPVQDKIISCIEKYM